MFELDIEKARVMLLKKGVTPKYVRRYVRELKAHRKDILDALVAEGMPVREAGQEADTRIGDVNEIAREMLNKRELQSFISVNPKISTLILPFLCYVLCGVLTIVLMIGLISTLRSMAPGMLDFPVPIGLRYGMHTLLFVFTYLAPCLLGAVLIWQGRERLFSRKLLWMGVVLIGVLTSLLSISIGFPTSVGEMGTLTAKVHFFGLMPWAPVFSEGLSGTGFVHLFSVVFSAFIAERLMNRKNQTLNATD